MLKINFRSVQASFLFLTILFLGSFFLYFIGKFLLYDFFKSSLFSVFAIEPSFLVIPSFYFIFAYIFALLGSTFARFIPLFSFRVPFVSFLLGFLSSESFVLSSPSYSSSFKIKRLPFLTLLLLLVLIFFYFTVFLSFSTSIDFSQQRILSINRLSLPLILLMSLSVSYSLLSSSSTYFRLFILISSISFVSLFTFYESSRLGLVYSVPIWSILLLFGNTLYHRKIKLFRFLALCQILITLYFYVDSRTLGISKNLFSLFDSSLFVYLLPLIQYPTGFSFGNFAQQLISIESLHPYTFYDLVSHSLPFASFLQFSHSYELYDFARSVCGSVSLISLSPLVFFLFWFCFGVASFKSLRLPLLLRVFAFSLLSVDFIFSFQYNAVAMIRILQLVFLMLILTPERFSRIRYNSSIDLN